MILININFLTFASLNLSYTKYLKTIVFYKNYFVLILASHIWVMYKTLRRINEVEDTMYKMYSKK